MENVSLALGERRVSQAQAWLVSNIPFLGFLLLRMQVTLVDTILTARIFPNGRVELNRVLAETSPMEELRWILSHEALHPALDHWGRRGSRMWKRWNLAGDLALNPLLESCPGLRRPSWVPRTPRWAQGKSAEALYEILPRRPELEEFELEDLVPVAATPEERARWQDACIQAHGAHAASCSGDSRFDPFVPSYVRKVPWFETLSHRLGSVTKEGESSFVKFSRRSESAGVCLPGRTFSPFPWVVVVWDTSGSMTGQEGEILAHVLDIVEDLGLGLRVIICDSRVQADVTDVQEATDLIGQIGGGGGSDFEPAFALLSEEGFTGQVVAFTDGFIHVPENPPAYDCLWVLSPGGRPPAAWGEALYLS